MYTYISHQSSGSGRIVDSETSQFEPNHTDQVSQLCTCSSLCSERSRREGTEFSGHESVTFLHSKVTKISMFFIQVSIKSHRREIWFFFLKMRIFNQHKYRHFLNFSTRAFNYYKSKYAECLCVAHALRAKVVNFEINYLGVGTVGKYEINLAYK